MNTSTKTTVFDAPRSRVFAYLSDVENLPDWATGFCKELRKENGDYVVVTPDGPLLFRIDHDERTGVIDMVAGPTWDQTVTWPARLASLPDDKTLLTFTAIQTPDLDDDAFAGQCAELENEFELIRKVVEIN